MNLARVTAVHPETNKVDLLFIADGRPVPGVRVMCADASFNSGTIGLATPGAQLRSDPLSPPAAGERTLIACVGYYDGTPVVQGFLFPEVAEMFFPDPERVMVRTPSDFYHTVDGQANAEWYHPGGAYVRIGTSPAHEDLTAKDRHKKFAVKRNTGNKVHIHVEQADGLATLDIDPDGNIVITTKANMSAFIDGNLSAEVKGNVSAEVKGNVSAEVQGKADVHTVGETTVTADAGATVKAPTVLVDSPDSTFTGKVTVQGLLTYMGGMVGSGSAGGGASAQIQGKVEVSEDVVAGSISLLNHVHMEQGDGRDVSKPK